MIKGKSFVSWELFSQKNTSIQFTKEEDRGNTKLGIV